MWEILEGGERAIQACLREDILAASVRDQQGQEVRDGEAMSLDCGVVTKQRQGKQA